MKEELLKGHWLNVMKKFSGNNSLSTTKTIEGLRMKQNTMFHVSLTAAAVAMFIAGTSLYAADGDDKIESSFQNTYTYKVYLKDDAIKADAKDGVVTLTGTVNEEAHKALAQETAANLPGVTSVNNQLATKAEVATENSDIWIGRKVKFALMFHRHVSYSATTVAVKDGVVTLTGKAVSQAQKELTTEYAKDIDGVKSVDNKMTVAASPEAEKQTIGEKIDDASVTAQVKLTLLNHKSTSALGTTVKTQDSVVTLNGVAKDDAEKVLVTKLVSDINGVESVNNLMTVK